MKRLLYCVARSPLAPGLSDLQGLQEQSIFTLTHQALTAVVSAWQTSEQPPTVEQLLAYEKIVTTCHQTQTIIPMRFGSTFDTDDQMVNFLIEKQTEYQALLDELADCDEMGVRILLPKAPPLSDAEPVTVNEPNGRAYLLARRLHYDRTEQRATCQQAVIAELCQTLHGLYVRDKHESKPLPEGVLHSVYFLVPRPLVSAWHDKLRQFAVTQSVKLLPSGPWPPYNFVNAEKPLASQLLAKLK